VIEHDHCAIRRDIYLSLSEILNSNIVFEIPKKILGFVLSKIDSVAVMRIQSRCRNEIGGKLRSLCIVKLIGARTRSGRNTLFILGNRKY
jgi:hypothetical protein